MNIYLTNFARNRHTPEGPLSHCELSEEVFMKRVHDNFDKWVPGYRDGVRLIPVETDGFYTSILQLQEGDLLVGEYTRRKENEDPRKHHYAAKRNKLPAKSVMIVVYHYDVLAEDNEQECDAEWQIVSINASPTIEETPITTGTLISNHLQLSGGTSTKMTDAEFVALLRKSIEFWKDKSMACPQSIFDKFNL